MHTSSSKGKEIRIPGPDHPITISTAERKVRVTVAGGIVADPKHAACWLAGAPMSDSAIVRSSGNAAFQAGLSETHHESVQSKELILSKAETRYRVQPDALAPMVDWLRHHGASPHAE